MTIFLQNAFDKRKELYAEADKLRAKGRTLWAEADKCYGKAGALGGKARVENINFYAEGQSLQAEATRIYASANKLCARADSLFYYEVIAKFGKDAVVTWNDDGSVEIEPHATKITLK